MKQHLRLALPVLTLALASPGLSVPAFAQDRTDFGLVAGAVVNMLMESHYSQKDFDDELSRKALQNYFDYLDYNRMYFTAPEIEQFRAKYETKLDDYVVQYKLTPAQEIYNLYAKRVNERSAKIKALIESGKLDFNTPESVAITRKNAAWPKDEAELDALWTKQITREILQERLNASRIEERKKEKAAKEAGKAAEKPADAPAPPMPAPAPAPAAGETPAKPGSLPDLAKKAEKVEKKPDTPEQKVLKRYERFLGIIKENDEEDVTNYFLSAIATAYDPHSEYMSAPEQDSFNIEMKKSLIGIGAQLRQKDGAAEIVMLIPGGPADKGGQLKVGDLVTGVGEGIDGEVKDVEGLKLQKIVEMIRGGENTVVRLRLMPAEDPTTTRDIMIQRAKVEMKDTLAKAELIELNKPSASPVRVGWITLDSFYADMENMGKKDARSATKDVKALLVRLMKENVSGVVLDLRNNGGGSLEEAIRLTGLFTKAGPVVQQRDNRDHSETRYSRGAEPVYAGPLVVVTDRASASASEICAAALQDTGRALIVGDTRTFGKGTVQTILDVGSNMPPFSAHDRAGSLKVTIQKFYRIEGGSTQREGVKADITFPSRFDAMEVGEEFLNGPLPWDKIKPVPFDHAPGPPLAITDLRGKSEARVASNPEFNYIKDYVTRTKDLLKRNTVSLNEKDRLAEDAENSARLKTQRDERKIRIAEANKNGDPYKVFPLTLDTVGEVQLKTDAEVKKEAKKEFSLRLDEDEDDSADEEEVYPHGIEPVKAETLHIVQDLLDLNAAAPSKSTAKSDR